MKILEKHLSSAQLFREQFPDLADADIYYGEEVGICMKLIVTPQIHKYYDFNGELIGTLQLNRELS